VSKGALVVAHGKREGSLYIANGKIDHLLAAGQQTSSTADCKTWHRRLGHMSEKGMQVMAAGGRLPGLSKVDLTFCEDCILGKQKKVSFSKTGPAPKLQKLELVHTDVWGPAQVPSVGNSLYFVTFIDDATRKLWVFFLKHKSDVFETFKKWRACVETETGNKLKCLKSDNGGEYCSKEFENFCSSHGIRRLKTVPGTPQQNGVAERMNRTILERARAMRIHSGLPKSFWADAVNTAVYLINRGPSAALSFGIPEEAWTGKKPTLSHLRVFGCDAYVMINPGDRSKLDPKSKKLSFIGYGGDEYGYRFWDHDAHKVVCSRDVVFHEDAVYKDREAGKSSTPPLFPNIADDMDGGDEPVGTDGEAHENAPEAQQQEPAELPIAVRKAPRNPRVPARYLSTMNYLLLTDSGEPESYEEVQQTDARGEWESAMEEEMQSLTKNKTWELVKLPKGKKALHNRWIYRIKGDTDGRRRYKARLVVKGYEQRAGVDYTDVFAPVVKLTTIRTVLSIVAVRDLHLEQMDVKTTFLHGDLEEEIYMHQPVGFEERGKESLVCRLRKSLYGLKQAPRQWYIKFENFMEENGFLKCDTYHCCFIKRYDRSYVILLIYVDDMLIAGPNMTHIEELKTRLSECFEMKDLGPANHILGMRIIRDRSARRLRLSQQAYVEKILEKFGMKKAKPVGSPFASHFKLSKTLAPKTAEERESMADIPYASAVGSLMYAMVCTRPDIAQGVRVVSRYMSDPGK